MREENTPSEREKCTFSPSILKGRIYFSLPLKMKKLYKALDVNSISSSQSLMIFCCREGCIELNASFNQAAIVTGDYEVYRQLFL